MSKQSLGIVKPSYKLWIVPTRGTAELFSNTHQDGEVEHENLWFSTDETCFNNNYGHQLANKTQMGTQFYHGLLFHMLEVRVRVRTRTRPIEKYGSETKSSEDNERSGVRMRADR